MAESFVFDLYFYKEYNHSKKDIPESH